MTDKKDVLISIVIPSYNHEKFINKAIDSVLEQNIENFELIVIDDASQDKTVDLVSKYLNDERITLIVNPKNLGSFKNNSKAITLGQGKYFVWLHGDDFLLPGHLSDAITALEQHKQCVLAYSPCYWVDDNDNVIKLAEHPGHKQHDYYGGRNEVAELLAYDNYITPSSVVFRKKALEKFSGFDITIRAGDWYLFTQLALKFREFIFLKRASTAYRIHENQFSQTEFYNSDKPLAAHIGILEKALNYDDLNWVRGWGNQIKKHLLNRLSTYPEEKIAPFEGRINQIISSLNHLGSINNQDSRANNSFILGDSVPKLEVKSKPLEVNPLVSVIVPTMNRPDLLERALKSLVDQTYNNWQAVVVNDAGEDVQDLVMSIDPLNRIQYVCHAENQGLPSARNTAIKTSTGSVICYLDDDDLFLPEHIGTIVDTLKTSQANFVYCEAVYVADEKQGDKDVEISRSTPYSGISYSKDRLDISNFIPVNTWGHRRDLLEKSGLFDKSLTSLEDWEILLRFSRLTDFIHVPKLTVEVHQRVSSGNDHMLNRERDQLPQLFRELYDRYPVTNSEVQNKRIEVLASWGLEYKPASVGFAKQATISASSPLEKALLVQEYLGGSLVEVARMTVRNNPKDFSDDNAKYAYYYDIAEEIFRRHQEQGNNFQDDSNIALKEAMHLLGEGLGEGSNREEALKLREKLSQLQQTKNYQSWIQKHHLREIDGQLFAERMMMQWKYKPVFHCIMFLYPGEENLLADTLDAFGLQLYQDWRLTVIAETPAPDPLWQELEVLNWVEFKEGDHPYELLNRQVSEIPADWVALIEPGTKLPTYALIQIGDYINIKPDWKLIYTDEDEIEQNGDRINPKFKPDFNLDLLRSSPYVGNYCVIEKDCLLKLGGFESAPNAENYDAVFKVYDLLGEQAVGHIDEVLFHKTALSNRAIQDLDIKSTIKRHLDRNAIEADVDAGYFNTSFRVNYKHQQQPKVSIIIPTKDKLEYLAPCVESLFKKTAYPNFEVIIVDNQSEDPDVFEFYSDLKAKYSEQVKVIDFPKAFNFSAICNYAAEQATGEYLLLLNNDTEILQAEWLDRMMAYAMREDVGVVGARLVFPERGLLQHAGIVMGMNGVADHPFIGNLHLKEPGYMGRAQLDQNYSAVTGACLLIETKIYQAVSGMDEQQFAISYNDVDLCLKVREAGYRVVWTPFATLIHHGSVSQNTCVVTQEKQQRFKKERAALFKKWHKLIAADPAYNRHLSLVNQDYSVEHAMPCNWDVNFHDRLRILGVPLEGGSGDYRVIQPFEGLSNSGLAQCEYVRLKETEHRAFSISEIARQKPDVLVIHSILSDPQLQLLEQCKKWLPEVFIIYMMDDLVNQIPEKSSAYKKMKRNFRNAKPRVRKALSFCDRAVVSTQPLAEFCQGMIEDIKILPNSLQKQVWLGLESKPDKNDKLRIGWAGALQHQGDLEMIADVVKQTANDVDWVFMGMCPDSVKPYIKEFHEPVPIADYPKVLAGLKLDLAIAPLENNAFNEAKSNLRLLEYGVLGWPVICSNVYPYRDAPVTCVENTTESWLSAIRHAIENREQLAEQGNVLRKWVLADYLLKDNLDNWLEALTPTSLQFTAETSRAFNPDQAISIN